jgi:predicted enzyme related to lactoylglutathione lyase
MSRIVHFEIQGSQPQALVDFYTELLSRRISRWEGAHYWSIEAGPADKPGINGGLLPRPGGAPSAAQTVNAFVCTAEVESLDQTLAKAMSPDAGMPLPKSPVPGVGWLAYIEDPDGNIIGLLQPDQNAK